MTFLAGKEGGVKIPLTSHMEAPLSPPDRLEENEISRNTCHALTLTPPSIPTNRL